MMCWSPEHLLIKIFRESEYSDSDPLTHHFCCSVFLFISPSLSFSFSLSLSLSFSLSLYLSLFSFHARMFIHQSCSSCCHSTTGSSYTGLLRKLLAYSHDIMTQVYGQFVTCFQTSWKRWWSLQRTLNLCLTWTIFFILFSSSLSVFYSAALVSMQLTALQSLTLSVQTDPVFFKVSVVVMDTVAS